MYRSAILILEWAKNTTNWTSVMIYDGFWFYTNVFELKRKSIFEFEKKFVHLYIKHILFVIGYLQTNDNLKQLHEEI